MSIESSLNAAQQHNRRHFLTRAAGGLGGAALASLGASEAGARPMLPHRSTAKRVIYLFQSGAPSQFESFDYKPMLDAAIT